MRNLRNPGYVRAKFEKADFAYFAATWWPEASQDFLLLEVFTLIWIFMWDDEIDSEEADLGIDYPSAEEYRKSTLKYISVTLGLCDCTLDDEVRSNILITSFGDIAALLSSWDFLQRQLLYDEIEMYVNATGQEQYNRLYEPLPRLDVYLQCRMSTSGVGVICFGLLDYMAALRDDASLSPIISEIVEQVNIMISIENDILSLKKELEADTPDSTIPILWASLRSLTQAIDRAFMMLREARHHFDAAEKLLLKQCRPKDLPIVQKLLKVCKTNCTGNLQWSLATQRYGIPSHQEGQMMLVL